jgi:hypothetical protein
MRLMGKATVMFREMRFVIHDDLTHCFVLCEAGGDCPVGVQGWHYKAFAPDVSVQEIVRRLVAGDSPVLWPQMAPEELPNR